MGKINIVKTATLPQAIYTFNKIPMKIPVQFFPDLQKNFKFHMKKQNNPPWYWHKNRYSDQRN